MERDAKRARTSSLLPQDVICREDTPEAMKNPSVVDTAAQQHLVVMVLDVDEGPAGSFHIWGRTSEGSTILVQVHDYRPYLYIPAPVRVMPEEETGGNGSGLTGDRGGRGGGSQDCPATAVSTEWSDSELEGLRAHWNSRLPPELRISSVAAVVTRPIMYFRPAAPAGAPYLRLTLRPGGSSKRAAAALVGLTSGSGREGALLEQQLGMRFVDRAVHEAEVKLLTRFLCDTALSGGAWFFLPAKAPAPPPSQQQQQQQQPARDTTVAGPSPAVLAAMAGHSYSHHHHPHPDQLLFPYHYTPVEPGARVSACDIEVVASWRALQSLTPDATQLADHNWCPDIVRQAAACTGGDRNSGNDGDGAVAVVASAEGPAPPPPSLELRLAAAVLIARDGRIAPLTVLTVDVLAVPYNATNRTPLTSKDDPVICIGCDVRVYGTTAAHLSGAAAAASVAHGSSGIQPYRVVFLLTGPGLTHGSLPLPRVALQGAELRCFNSERELLLAWKQWFLQVDPDIVTTFQVRDTLGSLRDRFERLRLEGGGLLVSRLAPLYGRSGGAGSGVGTRGGGGGGAASCSAAASVASSSPASSLVASPLTVRSVVMYSVAWVKRQGRMSSTSNQETFQAEVKGRVVMDVLRQVLTSQPLATFSLVDCCQSLLGETLEVLSPFHLARLGAEARGVGQPRATAAAAGAAGLSQQHQAAAAAARITSYIVRRVDVIVRLMERLATLPEAFEMARVTGLTIPQVMYNAQMIRTWSLLHRNAHRQNYIIGGRQEAGNLIESPFLMHPIENRTAGLYRSPVATLDFASLYPSLYRAYNLCYTTLVHPDDVAAVGRERCGFTPTGHAFVKPEVRHGILPSILAALMAARTATRNKLKSVQQAGDLAAAAVLDSRQKALKVTANALYGFTGAAASPLQCLPLADSCLALGAAACRSAIAAITRSIELEEEGEGDRGQLEEQLGRREEEGRRPDSDTGGGPSSPGSGGASGLSAGGAVRLGRGAAGGRVIYAQTDSVFVHFPRATPEEAVRLGKKAAALVTSLLPAPLELRFERVLAPFLLLHVNRYAGRAVETEEDAAELTTRGSLLVKGVRSSWRQSAPLVSQVLHGSLERLLMRDDVAAAVSYAEGHIRRLLSGRVELGELIMTGGLWRVTGQQVAAAAAGRAVGTAEGQGVGGCYGGGNAGGAGGGSGPHAPAAAAPPADDVRGPHAALAVRLSHRDPGRRFLLGERLGYVLLAGARTQDEAAEDPLTAAERGSAPALELYWRNKLMPPLKELFALCLSPTALQALMSGPHTLIRVDAFLDSVGLPAAPVENGGVAGAVGPAAVGGMGGDGGEGAPDAALSLPGSPSRSHAGGSRFGLAMTPRSPPSAGKTRGGKHAGGSSGAGGGLQSGLSSFFRQSARCLACKRVLPGPAPGPQGGGCIGGNGSGSGPYGLCSSCLNEPDTPPATYLRLLADDNGSAAQLASCMSTCAVCHSGGRLGAVLCENGECGVMFGRLGAARRLAASGAKLERMMG